MKSFFLIVCLVCIFAARDAVAQKYAVDESFNIINLRALSTFVSEYKDKTGRFPVSLEELEHHFSSLIDGGVIYECSFYSDPGTGMKKRWAFGSKYIGEYKVVVSSDAFFIGEKIFFYILTEAGYVKRIYVN